MSNDQKLEVPASGGIVVFRYWHVFLMLAVQLLALGIAYGKITQNQEDMTRRMESLENQKFVTRDEFDGTKQDIRDSLDRIEKEVLERNELERLK